MTTTQETAIRKELQRVPNVGPAIARDLMSLGIRRVEELAGRDPRQLYDQLCAQTGRHHDPCVLDTFMAAVAFAEGGPALPWWHFTPKRKAMLGGAK